MEPVSDLLGDQGGVAVGPVIDNEVHRDLVFYSLVHDFNGILDHLRIQHAIDHFVKREGFGIGFLVAHPTPPHLGKLLPQRRHRFPSFMYWR